MTPGYLRLPGFLAAPFRWRALRIPSIVAVLQRADGSVILVDCGFARGEIEEPRRTLGSWRQYAFPVFDAEGRRAPKGLAAVDQLALAGIQRERVTTIIATHLHLDHIGGFVDFPNAEVLTTADEIDSARKRGALAGYIHVAALQRSGRLRVATWTDGERHGFPRHHDVLGDGSVTLIDAKGHTAGSVAVLVAGRYLMAGDAAYSVAEYRTARMSLIMRLEAYRRDWVRATWEHLRQVDTQFCVVPAHDPECLARLPQL